MTINSISSAESLFHATALRNSSGASETSSLSGLQQDDSQVSDFAKLMEQLESLRTSDPDKYKDVTAKVATQLEDAAKSAASNGDTQAASALNDLASKFKTASETGEQVDLRPSGGSSGPPSGPPPMGPPPGANDTSSTDDSTSSTDDETSSLSALLAKYQKTQSTDPMSSLESILESVLSSQAS